MAMFYICKLTDSNDEGANYFADENILREAEA